MDAIHLEGIELRARIGVSEGERAAPQRLSVSITLWPVAGFDELEDQVAQAVDYAAVCDMVRSLVAAQTDKLIETLAGAIASHLLATFPIARVRVEVRKFILPDVDHVAVVLTRERPAGA